MSEGNAGRMDHNRFEELKEAYALNALSDEERQDFERYLSENPSEQSGVDELSSIASLLALAPQEQEPPAGLRRSLISQVRSEASEAGESESGGRETVPGGSREHRDGWARRLLGLRGLATATAAAAIIGLGVWNVSLQSEVQDLRDANTDTFEMSAFELQGSGEAESVQGEVVRLGDEAGMLVATDLPELPEGKVYEMWTVDDGGQPRSCGVFDPGDGPAIQSMEQSLSGAESFAITVEPEGGSEQPTTEHIVEADLTSST